MFRRWEDLEGEGRILFGGMLWIWNIKGKYCLEECCGYGTGRENTVWRNAVDMKQEGGSKEERNLEGINLRGRGPKMFRSTIGEGEDEKKKKMMMIQDHLSELM